MKRIFVSGIWVLVLAAITLAQNQNVNQEQSNIEKFSAKSGTLIEKKFIDIGKLKDVKVQVLVITDMMGNAKVSGVRFEIEKAGRYTSDTKVAFLDQDEVDGLVKSINILKTSVLGTTRDSYTEIAFRSRSGFEAGAYFGEGKWTTFMKLERFDKDSYVFLQPEDFDTLASLLQQAKQKFV